MFVKEVIITGDRGIDYKIDFDSQLNPRCSCPAFSNRKQATDVCKHITYMRTRMLKRPRPARATVDA